MTPLLLAALTISVLCVVGAANAQGWDRTILILAFVVPWALVGGAWWAMTHRR